MTLKTLSPLLLLLVSHAGLSYADGPANGDLAASPSIAGAKADKTETLVQVASQEVFIPDSYDDNDEAVVVLDGVLPNGCYKLDGTEVRQDVDGGAFEIVQYAQYTEGPCIQVVIPFYKVVSLGILPAGEFKVSTKGVESGLLTVVEAAVAGPEEIWYAPVSFARIERGEDGQRFFAVIQGEFTDRCSRLDEVSVLDKGKTIEVLPVLEQVQATCSPGPLNNPFSWMVELPRDMEEGRHLLHVRSLNGKSVNLVFTVYRDTI